MVNSQRSDPTGFTRYICDIDDMLKASRMSNLSADSLCSSGRYHALRFNFLGPHAVHISCALLPPPSSLKLENLHGGASAYIISQGENENIYPP